MTEQGREGNMRLEIRNVMDESIGNRSILLCEVCHVDEIENVPLVQRVRQCSITGRVVLDRSRAFFSYQCPVASQRKSNCH